MEPPRPENPKAQYGSPNLESQPPNYNQSTNYNQSATPNQPAHYNQPAEYNQPANYNQADNRNATNQSTYTGTDKLIGVILCFFFPFIAVGLKRGVGAQFWINLVLWFFFFFPGFIHGLYIVLKD